MLKWKKVSAPKSLAIKTYFDQADGLHHVRAVSFISTALEAEILSQHSESQLVYSGTESSNVWRLGFSRDDVAVKPVVINKYAVLEHTPNSCPLRRTHQIVIKSKWTPLDGSSGTDWTVGVYHFNCDPA